MRVWLKVRASVAAGAEFTFIPEYQKYKFRGKFDLGDEPLVALSMAVNNCRPIPFIPADICCYWEHVGHVDMDITRGKATVDGQYDTILLHWGTRFTRELVYKKQAALLEILETPDERSEKSIAACAARYDRMMRRERIKRLIVRVKNKILRTVGIKK